jgi:predicted XRE-type DNA-binding protein
VNRVDPIPQLKRDTGAVLARAFANWSAHDVAAMISTDAQRVMEIRRGALARFSLETLIRYATRLGMRVEVRITDR